jgi:hypothetical protein
MSDGQTDGSAGKRGLKEKLFHPFNHKASEKIEELQSRLASTKLEKPMIKVVHAKHKAGKFTNIFNSNHRHDEEHEQATDDKRSRIAENHRFNSFAPERDNNLVKWYVDGRDYFWVRMPRASMDCYSLTPARPSQKRWSKQRRQFTLPTGGYHLSWSVLPFYTSVQILVLLLLVLEEASILQPEIPTGPDS